jgi:hypothetical protein
MIRTAVVPIAFGFVLLSACRSPQSSPLYVDSSLAAEIRQIRSIDNHAHPVKVVGPGEQDRDFDALPADSITDPALPTPLRDDSAYFPEAWHALFGYRFPDAKPDHVKEVADVRARLMKQKGDLYPVWVLNQIDTDIMLANRVSMGRGLSPDRFKWVPFADMLLFPLNNSAIKAEDTEHKGFMESEEKLLHGYLAEAQLRQPPPSFDDYLTFVTHRLESWRSAGAVAVKFELAYLRDLQISNPTKETADRVYSIYAQSSEPTPDEYKTVQDYIFRYISREAGRLGMAVHIHTSIGAGSYFRDSNANPFEMEDLFNDPPLRRTKFVMLHGAFPFASSAAALILKPNVYVDFSALYYLTYPVEEARDIRLYLEAAPERVLYGSDASPFSSTIGWEETGWIAAQKGRLSLGIALTGMIHDGEITVDRAKQIAHMVLRDNARRLYGL